MRNQIMTVSEACTRIEAGAVLMVAGSENALKNLPRGNWIGGTTVYFITEEGGVCDSENLFVTEIDSATSARSRYFTAETLPQMTESRFDRGISLILIPCFSDAHAKFAIEGTTYQGIFDQPLLGWVTGTHLEAESSEHPKVIDGATGQIFDEGAVLLYVELKENTVAELDIVNVFSQDPLSDEITFPEEGFTVRDAYVNGDKVNFSEYVTQKGIDTKLPLVADYAGAMINVSFKAVDAETGTVAFYAPVVSGIKYRVAQSPGQYQDAFTAMVSGNEGHQDWSCNCILNYVHCDLEGKKFGSFMGPVTFGEIAYILLNQTMVHLKLGKT